MNKEEKCPYCGCKDMVQGRQDGYSAVIPASKMFTFKNQPLYHLICLNCGAVVKSYIKKPEKLVVKK